MTRFGIYTTNAVLLPQRIEAEIRGLALDTMMPVGFEKLSEIETYDAGILSYAFLFSQYIIIFSKSLAAGASSTGLI